MTQELGTFDFDENVVQGWRDKSKLREWELSKFAPLAKLYAVLKQNDIKKGENRGFEVKIEDKNTTVRIEEIGKIISQTESSENFRGGIGLTEVSTKYVSVEAGALEVRVGIVISNFEQLSSDKNKSVMNLFYPGKDFLLVYGWETDHNTASLFKNVNGSIPTIRLDNFDKGMRRYLYCTLHHFDWNLGDQGRIYGVLNFWTPDTVRLSIKRIDQHLDQILTLLSGDVQLLYNAFKEDVEKVESAGENADNRKVLNKIKEIIKAPESSATRQDMPAIFAQLKSVGIGVSPTQQNPDIMKNTIVNATTFEAGKRRILDTKTEKIYLGWVVEAIKYANNTEKNKVEHKNMYVKYRQFMQTHAAEINYPYTHVDFNSEKDVLDNASWRIEFDNAFFVPVDFTKILEWIKNFKGSFKFFLDSLLQEVNNQYDGIISLILRIENGVYYIDDLREKVAKKDTDLQTSINGKTYYKNDDKHTPVLTYGFTNSLVYNVKISSTIDPNIIWAQGISFKVTDDEATKLVNQSFDRVNNPQYASIYDEFIKLTEEDRRKKVSEDKTAREMGNPNQKNSPITPSERPDLAKQAVDESLRKDKTLSVLVLANNVSQGRLTLGTILRNYFNGLTLTIHGTAGFQAFKPFLFKGFELMTTKQGIDGLYQIILVNDIVTPKGFQTIVEARRANSLPIL